jgi:lipoate-protein ligase A
VYSDLGNIMISYVSRRGDVAAVFDRYLSELTACLVSLGLAAEKSGRNDILIDGTYKVASSSTRQFGKVLFSAFHISHEVNLNIIKSLCTKPMKKIPRGLGDYGITESEIIELFYRFINLV